MPAGVTYAMPPQYIISPNTVPAAASVEVAPAEGVTYTVAPTQQYIIQQPGAVTYAAPEGVTYAAPAAGGSYTMGQSYTYLDYDNASFVEVPVVADATTTATTTTKALKSSKKKSKKKSSKKFGCC